MEAPEGLTTETVETPVDEITLLEEAGYVNAHYMPSAMLDRLAANMKRDGGATSAVLLVRVKGKGDHGWIVASGNHRVKAARKAGLKGLPSVRIVEEIDEDRMKALQLSHNRLVGADNAAEVAEIYASIADAAEREATGFDDQSLALLLNESIGIGSVPAPEFQPVQFLFLPDEKEKAAAAFEQAASMLPDDHEFWVACRSQVTRFSQVLEEVGQAHNAKNMVLQLMLVLSLAELGFDRLSEVSPPVPPPQGAAYPVSAILGTRFLAASKASRLDEVLRLIMEREKKTRAEAVEKVIELAEDYVEKSG